MNKKSRTRLLIATGVIVVVFVIGVIFLIQKQGAYYRQVADLRVAGPRDSGVDHGDELALATFVDRHAASYAARRRPPSHDLIILRTVEMAQRPLVGYTMSRRSPYDRGYPRE